MDQMFVLPAYSREAASRTIASSNQLSFQDQVYRFAEIKALFEVASPSSRMIPGPEQSALNSSVGSGSHSIAAATGAAFEDPKLNQDIKRHKERIINGRNASSRLSPRSQIHKPKAVARQHVGLDSTQGPDIVSSPASKGLSNSLFGSSDSMVHNFDDSGSTSAKVQQIQEQIQLLQLQLQLQQVVHQSSSSLDSPSLKNSFGMEMKQSMSRRIAEPQGASLSTRASVQKPPSTSSIARGGTGAPSTASVTLLSPEAFSAAVNK